MSETHLLVRIASGDKAAVSEFVDRYGGLIWSLANRFSKNKADAEDAVQEVFIDLWKSASRYDPSIAKETTFVSMVTRRRLIDRARGKKLDAAGPDMLEEVVSDNRDASELVELDDEAQKAVQILDQLPPDQCRTIRLAIFSGMSHSQIAESTGLSLGTVKTNIRRGLIAIREKIGITPPVPAEGGAV